MKSIWFISASACLLAACTQATQPASEPTAEQPPEMVDDAPIMGSLAWAAAGEWRSDDEKARDVWRNPVETLIFFEIANNETVVEIWPGGGWYSKVIAPFLKQGGGKLIGAGFDPSAYEGARRERTEQLMSAYRATMEADPETFGTVELSSFSHLPGEMAPPESVDTVLTFRNVHNWMAQDYAAKFFDDAFAALRPGGILGVVEHRLPSSMEQDPRARSGYVHEDVVKALAAASGFEFVAASELNANPADTADHPFGVWTLPPSSRDSDFEGNTIEGFDPAIYLAIGESDRMTLKFRKPRPDETEAGEPALEPVE